MVKVVTEKKGEKGKNKLKLEKGQNMQKGEKVTKRKHTKGANQGQP